MGPRHNNERTLGHAQCRKILETGITPKKTGIPQFIVCSTVIQYGRHFFFFRLAWCASVSITLYYCIVGVIIINQSDSFFHLVFKI